MVCVCLSVPSASAAHATGDFRPAEAVHNPPRLRVQSGRRGAPFRSPLPLALLYSPRVRPHGRQGLVLVAPMPRFCLAGFFHRAGPWHSLGPSGRGRRRGCNRGGGHGGRVGTALGWTASDSSWPAGAVRSGGVLDQRDLGGFPLDARHCSRTTPLMVSIPSRRSAASLSRSISWCR